MKSKPTDLSRRGFLRTLLAMPIGYLLAACGFQTTTKPASAPTSAAIATEPPTQAPLSPTQAPTQPTAPTQAAQVLPATPACGDNDDITPAQTEGPYYTPNTPERMSFLEPGITGTRIVVAGYVLSTNCRPVARALLDFWHADDAGVYDNVGYKLREDGERGMLVYGYKFRPAVTLAK